MSTTIIPLSQLPLSDDFMFGEVMRQPEVCQLFWSVCWKRTLPALSISANRRI